MNLPPLCPCGCGLQMVKCGCGCQRWIEPHYAISIDRSITREKKYAKGHSSRRPHTMPLGLTPLQHEVVMMLCQGEVGKQIQEVLGISLDAMHTRLNKARDFTKSNTTNQLCYRMGYVMGMAHARKQAGLAVAAQEQDAANVGGTVGKEPDIRNRGKRIGP